MTAIEPALRELRTWLEMIGFHDVYKYIVGANGYSVSPSHFQDKYLYFLNGFSMQVRGETDGMNLLNCLTACQDVELASLTAAERRLAELLMECGLLKQRDNLLINERYQLISLCNMYLLVDIRIHFHRLGVHEVYIGPDSTFLLYYIATEKIRPDHHVLDMCMGTGVIGICLSRFSDHVLSTDIGEAPLLLAPLNRVLNGKESSIEIRREDLRETMARDDKFDLITCNPPFVATPPELKSPLYALGAGADGLDYVRLLIERSVPKLNPGGEAFFVADLVGDDKQPYFVQELENYAEQLGATIDIFIDHKIDRKDQIQPISSFLHCINPDVPRDRIVTRVAEYLEKDLKADFYYLSTLRIRPLPDRRGVRVFNRYRKNELSWIF
jgi:methylase of polypeptide subunit release factors